MLLSLKTDARQSLSQSFSSSLVLENTYRARTIEMKNPRQRQIWMDSVRKEIFSDISDTCTLIVQGNRHAQ